MITQMGLPAMKDINVFRWGGGYDVQISCVRTECLWVARQHPPLGAHVVTPRHAYLHHGIYVGDGKVVHYAGLAHGWRRGAVEEISLTRFASGHPLYTWSGEPTKFDSSEVVWRARSRLGENDYRLLTNNCEHFCHWCLSGEHRSLQVEQRLAQLQRAIVSLSRCVGRLLSSLQRSFVPRFDRGGFSNGTERA